jgi:hypothetical protein
VLRVDRGTPDHFVQCLIGEASVGMDLISVPSQLVEEAVVVTGMDVRGVRSGTVDSFHPDIPLLVMGVGRPRPTGQQVCASASPLNSELSTASAG